MYIDAKTAKRLTIPKVKKAIKDMAENVIKNKYATARECNELKEALLPENEHLLDSFARQLVNLNNALLSNKDRYKNSVFAVCQKEPRNLDSGRHYYSVWYIHKGEAVKFWSRGFSCLVGAEINERDRNLDKFIFSSRAIGMSRLLDATDGLFTLLKRLGGAYCQISTI